MVQAFVFSVVNDAFCQTILARLLSSVILTVPWPIVKFCAVQFWFTRKLTLFSFSYLGSAGFENVYEVGVEQVEPSQPIVVEFSKLDVALVSRNPVAFKIY